MSTNRRLVILSALTGVAVALASGAANGPEPLSAMQTCQRGCNIDTHACTTTDANVSCFKGLPGGQCATIEC